VEVVTEEQVGIYDVPVVKADPIRKFKGRLSPAQMREDLALTLVGDEAPYTKHIFVW
jgi:hypothetical protein